MKLLRGLSVAVSFTILGAMSGCDYVTLSSKQREFHNTIKDQVRQIAEQYIGEKAKTVANDSNILVRGDCVLIGLTDEVLSNGKSWEWLWLNIQPNELRPQPDKNQKLTVFVVSTQKLEQVGYYRSLMPSGRAYRARYDIFVLYWPELNVAGTHSIISDPPRRKNTFGTEIGEPVDVVSWILKLPRTTSN